MGSLHLAIESGEYGLRELMRLGDEAEIVGRAAVRAQMASMGAMTRRYRTRCS
jgi:hypothetical protein